MNKQIYVRSRSRDRQSLLQKRNIRSKDFQQGLPKAKGWHDKKHNELTFEIHTDLIIQMFQSTYRTMGYRL